MMRFCLAVLVLVAMLSQSSGSQDEATGRVTHVVDGDTFDVELQTHDGRISQDQIRVRLADIDCPETRGPKACEAGKKAAEYTRRWLQSAYVSLDLDNKTGLDKYTRWVAVAYIRTSEGQLRNFNKMLVDAGHAVVKDYKDNEFDPRSWWAYWRGRQESLYRGEAPGAQERGSTRRILKL